jgi:transposase
VIYLNVFQHLPYDRIQEMLATVAQIRLSQGTIRNMLTRISRNLQVFEADIKKQIAGAALAQFDETGAMVDAINHWIHSASTVNAVYYEAHPNRGKQAMDAIGILPRFAGVGVHDFWASYFRYDFSHSLCCAHLLRELVFQKEEMGLRWAGRLIRLLRWMKRKRDEGESPGSPALLRARKRWEQIIRAALSHTPAAHRRKGKRGRLFKGKARSLLERLRDYADECLRFAFAHGVPFDNNLSERDIRMVKVKQKVSGGFRSFLGLRDFCRIRSYVATMIKRGTGAMASLIAVALDRPIPVIAE